ncbi:MAG TPA: hypothetical protein VMD48_07665 [Solirubrobacteraceae bacterium]|nr:hypothetical protein [Solirubrobacteraceae bacterium]
MKRTMSTLLIACGVAVGCASVAIAGSSPTVSTGSATKIGDSSATLNGTVNPQGTKTAYQFDYGLTDQYGLQTKVQNAGSGTKVTTASAGIGNLIPGTTYHYKLIALSKSGTSQGSDRTFKTAGHPPPVVATGPPSAIHQSSVTLTGTINPNDESTTWEFQYGLNAFYGSETVPAVLPASTVTSVVSATVNGLEPGVTFHYRLVALHGSVSSDGADATVFTLPDPAPTPRLRATTKPSRVKHRPYIVTTTGSVSVPSSVPASLACFGSASIRYLVNGHQVGSTLAQLLGNCTFSATARYSKLPGKRKRGQKTESLKVVIRFRGNGYIGPSATKTDTVTLG